MSLNHLKSKDHFVQCLIKVFSFASGIYRALIMNLKIIFYLKFISLKSLILNLVTHTTH